MAGPRVRVDASPLSPPLFALSRLFQEEPASSLLNRRARLPPAVFESGGTRDELAPATRLTSTVSAFLNSERFVQLSRYASMEENSW